MRALFTSDNFKGSASDLAARRDIIGNAIYEHVVRIVGEEWAPKVTGLIINLTEIELIPAISTLENLTEKVYFCKMFLEQMKLQQEQVNREYPSLPTDNLAAPSTPVK
jgi:Poly-adenylate binding protein, unique domain